LFEFGDIWQTCQKTNDGSLFFEKNHTSVLTISDCTTWKALWSFQAWQQPEIFLIRYDAILL